MESPRSLVAIAAFLCATACRDAIPPTTLPHESVLRSHAGMSARVVQADDPMRIATGIIHTCALVPNGVAQCWGDNTNAEGPPTRAAASGHYFTQIGAGYNYT